MKKELNINELLTKIDIVNVISSFSQLTKTGSSYKTLCNVHGDNSPSLSINPRKQIYKCFVCDHGGNALDYLIWAQKFTFQQAIEYLIKESGDNINNYSWFFSKNAIPEKEKKIYDVLNDAANLFHYYLNIEIDENEELKQFINERGISSNVIRKFKLGFAPSIKISYISNLKQKNYDSSTLINSSLSNDDGQYPFFVNRLIFPIFNENNQVVAFSGRTISKDNNGPKYLNSKDSIIFKKSSLIYNYQNAKKYDQLIIVEGFMDVIALSKLGFDNSIALMGVALTKEHILKLKKHAEILIFLDNDDAGKTAMMKLVNSLLKNNINCFILNNDTQFKDADEILNSNGGGNIFQKILENKILPIDFIYNYFFKNIQRNDFQALKNAIISLYKFIKDHDDFFKLHFISKIANDFKIKEDIIHNYFNSQPNVVELNKLTKKNIQTKKNLELELNEPLNINKVLISIWQNPSFLESRNLEQIKWTQASYLKVFKEIINYHQKKGNLSDETEKFLKMKMKAFSKESLPQDLVSFNELIQRTFQDKRNKQIKDISNRIKSAKSIEDKEELLKQKMELLSRKE